MFNVRGPKTTPGLTKQKASLQDDMLGLYRGGPWSVTPVPFGESEWRRPLAVGVLGRKTVPPAGPTWKAKCSFLRFAYQSCGKRRL